MQRIRSQNAGLQNSDDPVTPEFRSAIVTGGKSNNAGLVVAGEMRDYELGGARSDQSSSPD